MSAAVPATDPVLPFPSLQADPGGSGPGIAGGLLRRVLPGMVAHGHGIEFLCALLGLARGVLLDLMVELDLATPHDRPLRKPGGRSPWTFADTALFVVLWMAGWHAESLGERFGRTPGSIRSKARRLGLPRRDRKLVFRPVRSGEDLPGGPLQEFAPDLSCAEGDGVRSAEPASAPAPADESDYGEVPVESPSTAPTACGAAPRTGVAAAAAFAPAAASAAPIFLPFPAVGGLDLFGPMPVGLPPGHRPKRRQADWPRERDVELGQRWWARQHYKAIARDMGVSPKAVQDRARRLQLPAAVKLPHALRGLVNHFDPALAEANIAAAGYVERKCVVFASDGKVFWFWTTRRNGDKSSQEVGRLEAKRTARFNAPAAVARPSFASAHAW